MPVAQVLCCCLTQQYTLSMVNRCPNQLMTTDHRLSNLKRWRCVTPVMARLMSANCVTKLCSCLTSKTQNLRSSKMRGEKLVTRLLSSVAMEFTTVIFIRMTLERRLKHRYQSVVGLRKFESQICLKKFLKNMPNAKPNLACQLAGLTVHMLGELQAIKRRCRQ